MPAKDERPRATVGVGEVENRTTGYHPANECISRGTPEEGRRALDSSVGWIWLENAKPVQPSFWLWVEEIPRPTELAASYPHRPSSRARGQLLPNSIYQKYYIGSGLRLRHTQNGLWAFRSSQPLPQLPSGELNLAVNQVVHAHPNCTPTVHGRATTKQVPAGSSSFCLVAFITAQVKLCLPWYPRWALPLPTMHVVYDRVLWI